MATRICWVSLAKKMLGMSLVPNLILGYFIVMMEKFMEWEFKCPCDPKMNTWLLFGYFAAPAVSIFVVMSARGCKNKKCSNGWTKNVIMGFAHAILWLILLFLDGNYLACAQANWLGVYEEAPYTLKRQFAHQKWCNPNPKNSSAELAKTGGLRYLSKLIGLGLIVSFSLLIAPFMCCFVTDVETNEGNEDSETHPMSEVNQ